MNPELPPAGWYTDPEGSGGQRFWDGDVWTSAAMSADGRPVASREDTASIDPAPTAVGEPHPVQNVPVPPGTVPAGPAGPPPPRDDGPGAPGLAHARPSFPPAHQPYGTHPTFPLAGSRIASPAAYTTGLGDRLRTLPRGAWVAAGLVVLAVVLVAGGGATSYDVDGSFELVDGDYLYVADGSACSGEGGYSDIGSGLQVTVSDATGRLIASSALRSGRVDGLACVFDFQLTDVARSDYYTFEVGRRGEVTYSHAEMVSNGWEAGFVIGDD